MLQRVPSRKCKDRLSIKKIFSSHVSNTGFVSRILKELQSQRYKKTNYSIKIAMDLLCK